ncbi:MAG: flavodoxin-dependent (E)-4-hydroxy-3-methylbut-2-enyl-diphosphate synthase [Planctomycetes bacterium]|nr:flavodoxin-dependent (E)-4-hydroxy-3-methylbut-2-enyl-diphosphate synthase [Planctomycetota bacterium]
MSRRQPPGVPRLLRDRYAARVLLRVVRCAVAENRKLAEIHVPLKVAVMGCVVNGPGECEGADVAIFGGRGKGIIYVQREQKQTVPESQMLDALLAECRALAGKVECGEAQLKFAGVNTAPANALPRPKGSLPPNLMDA